MEQFTEDIFAQWLDAKFKNIHTCIPGEIQTYNSTTKKATVKPLIKLRTNQGQTLAIPPIDNVPVIFPIVKKFALDFPLEKADGGLIMFSEVGIGSFLNGDDDPTEDDLSKFNLTDAIFLPGLWSFNNRPTSKATIIIDNAGNININEGTNGSARENDEVKSTAAEDSVFWSNFATWRTTELAIATAYLLTLIPATPEHIYITGRIVALTAMNVPPLSLTGKITDSSDTVKIG